MHYGLTRWYEAHPKADHESKFIVDGNQAVVVCTDCGFAASIADIEAGNPVNHEGC